MNVCCEQYGKSCLLAQTLFNHLCCLLCVSQCISIIYMNTNDFTGLPSVGLRRRSYEALNWPSFPRNIRSSLFKCTNYKPQTILRYDFILCVKSDVVLGL